MTTLDAKTLDSEEARRVIAKGLWAFVNSKNSKLVMTRLDTNNHEYASFTLEHLKSSTRGDLYRSDTIDFDPNMKAVPGMGRVEIANELGNWELREEVGGEKLAFLLTNDPEPVDTVGLLGEFRNSAARMDAGEEGAVFTATNGTSDGKPTIEIAERRNADDSRPSVVYTIDPSSGAVTSMFGTADGISRYLYAAAPIDESDFDVPASREVVPVADGRAVQGYLMKSK